MSRFLFAGIVAGVIAGILTGSLFTASAFVALFTAMGMTWRKDQPPVFPFAIAHQWLYVVTGDIVSQQVQGFGGLRAVEDTTFAASLAIGGFVALALGVRLSWAGKPLTDNPAGEPEYNLRRLMFLTMGAYAINWAMQIAGGTLLFAAANLINNVLLARAVLLCMLWISIMRQRKGYSYGVLALLFVVVPSLASTQTKFKEVVFLAIVAALVGWRPWDPGALQQKMNRTLVAVLGVLAVFMIVVGAFWEGGVKSPWRAMGREAEEAQNAGLVEARSTMTQLSELQNVAEKVAENFSLTRGLILLAERIDSICQFSLVLDRVPKLVAHEDGALTMRAIKHITMPRILFPDKENLGTDSWLATTYAGINVGEGTSVGIGYMAEFYIDFGFVGMFIALVCFGAILGGICRFLEASAPSSAMGQALMIVSIVSYFTVFESNFAKLMGGLIMNVIVLWVIVKLVGKPLHQWLIDEKREPDIPAGLPDGLTAKD